MSHRFPTILPACVVLAVACLWAGPATAQDAPDAVESALYEAVSRRVPWPGAELSLSEVEVRGDVPSGGFVLELMGNRLSTRVRARLSRAEGEPADAWVSANLSLQVPALVAVRNVDQGEAVAGLLVVSMLPLDDLPNDFLADGDTVEGIARVPLDAGEPVRASQIDRPYLIERGETLTIEVRRGMVVVTDRGTAMENGRLDDDVRVRSLSSNEVLDAVVVGAGLVEVP